MHARLPSTFRRREGIALMEMAVAIAIVATTLIGVLQVYRLGIDHTQQANESALALRALTNELEYLRTLDAATLVTRNEQPFYATLPALNAIPRLTTHTTCTPDPNLEGLFEVTVTIKYPARKGRPISKTLTTWVAPR